MVPWEQRLEGLQVEPWAPMERRLVLQVSVGHQLSHPAAVGRLRARLEALALEEPSLVLMLWMEQLEQRAAEMRTQAQQVLALEEKNRESHIAWQSFRHDR